MRISENIIFPDYINPLRYHQQDFIILSTFLLEAVLEKCSGLFSCLRAALNDAGFL